MNRVLGRLFSSLKGLPTELSPCLQQFSDGLEFISLNNPQAAQGKLKECVEVLKLNNTLGGLESSDN